jgi:probable HAF family extracellular repeat protein
MRNRWLVSLATLTALFLSFGWLSAHAQSVSYSMTDLGTLGGAMSAACSINDRGQVTGKSATTLAQLHSFLWQDGAMTDLGTLPPLAFSEARSINNRGQVVGDSSAAGGPPFHAALWENRGVTPIGTLPGGFASFAIGVNNRGQLVGASRTANRDVHAFLWQDGEMEDLGVLQSSYQQSVARAINNRDQIVGNSSLAIGDPPPPPNRAFLWQAGEMTDLGTLGGDWSIAFGINASGQVAGGSFTAAGGVHGFLWQDGEMVDLGTLGGTSNAAQPPQTASCNLPTHFGPLGTTFSLANGINDRGEIVGRSIAANGEDHAFIWSDGVMSDLNDKILAGAGWVLVEAESINGGGQIVGYGIFNGQTHAFLLTPVED